MANSSPDSDEHSLEAARQMAIIVSEYYEQLIRSGVQTNLAKTLTIEFQSILLRSVATGFVQGL